MADFIKTPFKNGYVSGLGTSSDYEGAVKAGGDIEIKGQDVVVGGPQIADEPSDLFDYLKSLNR
jgi:hypothetical protein